MARTAQPGKPPKLSRAEKKAARVQRRAARRETWRNVGQAFSLTRRNDKRFLPYLIIFGVLAATVVYLLLFLLLGSPYFPIPVAVAAGVITAMLIFSRRAQRAVYAQSEGQPGAAGWMLQNQIRGDWRITQAVVGTAQLDAVHRVIGRPGVVLVGEGSPPRVRGLIAQEKKRVARVAGDAPIYDLIVGPDDGSIPLRKLNARLLKLPRNLSKQQVDALDKRLQALGGPRPPLPQGPMPAGAKVRNVQRSVRRRS